MLGFHLTSLKRIFYTLKKACTSHKWPSYPVVCPPQGRPNDSWQYVLYQGIIMPFGQLKAMLAATYYLGKRPSRYWQNRFRYHTRHIAPPESRQDWLILWTTRGERPKLNPNCPSKARAIKLRMPLMDHREWSWLNYVAAAWFLKLLPGSSISAQLRKLKKDILAPFKKVVARSQLTLLKKLQRWRKHQRIHPSIIKHRFRVPTMVFDSPKTFVNYLNGPKPYITC